MTDTVADIEIGGMELGIAIAKRIIRGYGTTPLMPDRNRVDVVLHGQYLLERAIIEGRENCGLNDLGEAAWRKGYERGYISQLKNPDAKIEIKRVKENG
jgi:hypothetical protein